MRTPARVGGTTHPHATIRDFLRARLPDRVPVAAWLDEARFVDATGTPIDQATPYTPATFIWFHKDLHPEPEIADLAVLHQDDRIVVIDKPHFLASIPRGAHVQNSALIKLRTQLDLPDLAPAHRLDRLTAGVMLFSTARRWRSAYQELFEKRLTTKTYEALAPALPELSTPTIVRSHITKRRGELQAVELPDEPPNAETLVTLVATHGDLGTYRLEPTTGRTHQLRVHLNGLGAPIIGDPLYPTVSDAPEDPTQPLRLIARTLAFTDPIDGSSRTFVSRVRFTFTDLEPTLP